MTSVGPNEPASEHSADAVSAGISRRGAIRAAGAGALALGLGVAAASFPAAAARKLTVQVLAIGGTESVGTGPGDAMKLAADNVQTLVIPGAGHWIAEQAPDQVLAALTAFLAPYRAAHA